MSEKPPLSKGRWHPAIPREPDDGGVVCPARVFWESLTTPQSQCAHWASSPYTGELIRNRDDITTPQSSALRETAADSSPCAGEPIRKDY